MKPFSYARTQEATAAVAAAMGHESASFIAGGTNLLDLMKEGVTVPEQLIDIYRLPLARIEALPDGGMRIEALVRNSDLAYHPLIAQRYPMLSQAILSGASAQLRNMATVGGNLMQRTRCYYFNDVSRLATSACLVQAVRLSRGTTAYTPYWEPVRIALQLIPSDMCVALIALDARIRTHGPRGERVIPMTDFYLLPGETPHLENVMEHGELITAVDVPALPFASRSHYLKVRDRNSYAFALVSVAAALEIEDGTIRQARLALGGVGTRPWRAQAAEQILVGAAAAEDTYRRAALAALEGAVPRRHNGFKVELACRAIMRALDDVAAQRRGNA